MQYFYNPLTAEFSPMLKSASVQCCCSFDRYQQSGPTAPTLLPMFAVAAATRCLLTGQVRGRQIAAFPRQMLLIRRWWSLGWGINCGWEALIKWLLFVSVDKLLCNCCGRELCTDRYFVEESTAALSLWWLSIHLDLTYSSEMAWNCHRKYIYSNNVLGDFTWSMYM